jgi:sulfate transport system ATP-binding protein
VHVTTVFVTHDQAEAMEISDQIAVLNHGRLEQTGAPRELYDEPASEFVMTFVGDANAVGDMLVRPHDLELLHEPAEGSVEAMIVRVFAATQMSLRRGGASNVALLTRDCRRVRLARQPVGCGSKHERASPERAALQRCYAPPTRHTVASP